MSPTDLLVTIGIAAQAAFIALLIWRRTYKALPIFFSYIVWGLVGDSGVLLYRTVSHSYGLVPYQIESYVDLTFQYLVLIELAWSILRPMKRVLPLKYLIATSIVIAAGIFVTWPMSALNLGAVYDRAISLVLHAQRSFALLRIFFFLIVTCCSQFLRIGWRDRELQIATGLGFYSLVSLAGIVVHAHQSSPNQYFYVDFAVASSYLMCLGYWVYCFAHQQAARREMTPEMQQFFTGMSGVMRKQMGRLNENKSTS